MKFTDFLMFPNVILNGNEVQLLSKGHLINVSQFCSKHFGKDQHCINHYSKLLQENGWKLCPYGYSSIAFEIDGYKSAVTGVIPFPRLGGKEEQIRAKVSKDQKVTREAVEKNILAVKDLNSSDKREVGKELSRNMGPRKI